jgi:thiamine biosynthesis lipoprotein
LGPSHLRRTQSATCLPLLLLALLLSACAPGPEALELGGSSMGTTYSVKVIDPPTSVTAATLAPELDAVLLAVNAGMSTYLPESELSRFNAARETGWTDASPALVTVVDEALRVSALTRGAFDVTVGPLVNLWGFGPGRGGDRVPSDAEVEDARSRTGHARLQVRHDPPALRKATSDLYVDLSAIAKGYAVDQLAEHLEARQVGRYLVEVGGEVRGRGRNARGTPWRVAIERPSPAERSAYAVIPVDGVGVATSGDYRNYFEQDGRRYSHTIDPATGRPIEHTLASVTVVSPTAMTADALATGLMVLGPDAGYALAEREGIAAFFIVRDGEGFVDRATPAFTRHVGADTRPP